MTSSFKQHYNLTYLTAYIAVIFINCFLLACSDKSQNRISSGGTIETTNGKIIAESPIENLVSNKIYLYSYPEFNLLDSTTINKLGEFSFNTKDYSESHFIVKSSITDSLIIWSRIDHLDSIDIEITNTNSLTLSIKDTSFLPDSLFIFQTPFFAVKNGNSYQFNNLPKLDIPVIVSHDVNGNSRLVSQFSQSESLTFLNLNKLYDSYILTGFNFPHDNSTYFQLGYWWSSSFEQFSDGENSTELLDSYGARVYDMLIEDDNYAWKVILDDSLNTNTSYSLSYPLQPHTLKDNTPWLYDSTSLEKAQAVDLTNLDSISFMAKGNCGLTFTLQNNLEEAAVHYDFEASQLSETIWTTLTIDLKNDSISQYWSNTNWLEMESSVEKVILSFESGCQYNIDDIVLYGVNLNDFGIIE